MLQGTFLTESPFIFTRHYLPLCFSFREATEKNKSSFLSSRMQAFPASFPSYPILGERERDIEQKD
jgi:hypothetical protein